MSETKKSDVPGCTVLGLPLWAFFLIVWLWMTHDSGDRQEVGDAATSQDAGVVLVEAGEQ